MDERTETTTTTTDEQLTTDHELRRVYHGRPGVRIRKVATVCWILFAFIDTTERRHAFE
jgi:hypothetical protein